MARDGLRQWQKIGFGFQHPSHPPCRFILPPCKLSHSGCSVAAMLTCPNEMTASLQCVHQPSIGACSATQIRQPSAKSPTALCPASLVHSLFGLSRLGGVIVWSLRDLRFEFRLSPCKVWIFLVAVRWRVLCRLGFGFCRRLVPWKCLLVPLQHSAWLFRGGTKVGNARERWASRRTPTDNF